MGQKVRPPGFRTGIMVDWNSRWYSDKQHFAELLLEDKKIRDFLKKKFGKKSGISKVQIDRTQEKVTIFIFSARVGCCFGSRSTSPTAACCNRGRSFGARPGNCSCANR